MYVICVSETAGHLRRYVREHDRASSFYVPSSRGSAEVCPEHDLFNKIYDTVPVQISSCEKSISFNIQYLVFSLSYRTSYVFSSAILKLLAF